MENRDGKCHTMNKSTHKANIHLAENTILVYCHGGVEGGERERARERKSVGLHDTERASTKSFQGKMFNIKS